MEYLLFENTSDDKSFCLKCSRDGKILFEFGNSTLYLKSTQAPLPIVPELEFQHTANIDVIPFFDSLNIINGMIPPDNLGCVCRLTMDSSGLTIQSLDGGNIFTNTMKISELKSPGTEVSCSYDIMFTLPLLKSLGDGTVTLSFGDKFPLRICWTGGDSGLDWGHLMAPRLDPSPSPTSVAPSSSSTGVQIDRGVSPKVSPKNNDEGDGPGFFGTIAGLVVGVGLFFLGFGFGLG